MISTRTARKLREKILQDRRRQVRFSDLSPEFHLEYAQDAVTRIRRKLSPLNPTERLRLEQNLAYWEAVLDSIEDDGVLAIQKGQE
ncbi:hypothetical protein [Arthrobacter pityocampae]|uniref:hypothetical protein n=1 Tax=Arthrobacter pityocampae TaxID=547334 RepID=UPI003736EE13